MNTTKKISLVSTLATASIIGTGYAAWAFQTTVTQDVVMNSTATATIEAREVTVNTSAVYLICDAPADSADQLADGNGLYWSTTNDKDACYDNKITTLTLTGKVDENDMNLADINSYTGKFNIKFDAVDTTYIDIAAVDFTTTVDVAVKDADCTYTYTLPSLTYAAVPTNASEVAEMENELAALTSMKFTVTFSVESSK